MARTRPVVDETVVDDANLDDPPIELELDDPDPNEPDPDEPDEVDPDEPEPDEVDPDEPDPVAATPTPRGPRGKPYGQQIRELEAARKADKEAFERQLAQLVSERRQPTQAELAAQQEQERQQYELMTPYEQHLYTQRKIATAVTQHTNEIEVRNWNQNDQREYAGLLESNPAYRRFDDRVNELRTQAPGVPRRVLLATAIGLKALEGGGAARTRAAAANGAVAARVTSKPAGGRGDVPAERGRRDGAAARDARLRAAGLIE